MTFATSVRSTIVIVTCLAALGGCASFVRYEDVPHRPLKGRVVVEWNREDKFIYRQQANALSFTPSFMTSPIVPPDMYTDGGSIPRIFWSVPGLSPWGLGPAYIIHDWIFEVHRCHRPAPPEVANMTIDQAAQALAEVAKALADAGLIDHNRAPEVVWAVQTNIAREIWKRPGTAEECEQPPPAVVSRNLRAGAQPGTETIVDFTIPSSTDRQPD